MPNIHFITQTPHEGMQKRHPLKEHNAKENKINTLACTVLGDYKDCAEMSKRVINVSARKNFYSNTLWGDLVISYLFI